MAGFGPSLSVVVAEGEDTAAVVFGFWVDPGVEAGEGGDGLERAARRMCLRLRG